MDKHSKKIYFAGDLFDGKDLGGNLMLAAAIEAVSNGRYQVMLPQDGECEVLERSAKSIRDADFKLLYSCDVVVANFDGHDLDSGTVVEFCFAKMLDMPTVLLRTDFRDCGDNGLPDGDPWNLMCSHYPRTRVLWINGMMRYHECKNSTANRAELLKKYYDSIAKDVVAALDDVVSRPSWLHEKQLLDQLRMAVKSVGGTVGELLDEESLQKLAAAKIAAGIYNN